MLRGLLQLLVVLVVMVVPSVKGRSGEPNELLPPLVPNIAALLSNGSIRRASQFITIWIVSSMRRQFAQLSMQGTGNKFQHMY